MIDAITKSVHQTRLPKSVRQTRITKSVHQTRIDFEPDELERPSKRPRLTIKGPKSPTPPEPATSGHRRARGRAFHPPPVQPNGLLLQTTNGVQTALNITRSDISVPPSSKSTSRNGTPQTQQKSMAKQDDKRTLRSQDDGPRLKSELAVYFSDYEDIMFGEPKEPDFITVDTAMYVTDDKDKPATTSSNPVTPLKPVRTQHPIALSPQTINGFASSSASPTTTANKFNGCQTIDFSMILTTIPSDVEDPLPESHFLKSHRRAERREKQLRNIERERAMHEKVHLERILDGLLGHDWLKVLGITGVTDGEGKKYEAKRDHFVGEVRELVEKFRRWKDEEKRQRLEKEAARHAEEEEEEEEEDRTETEASVEPATSEANASASKQLQQETTSSIKLKLKLKTRPRDPARDNAPIIPPPPPCPERPFLSFYAADKKYLRDAALGKARHGRNVYAFGHVVPEMAEREFGLPAGLVTEEALRANARERRRKRRASVADAASGGAA